ncbi:DUF362 domain-containing protein [Fundidesulfovibrio butyratiphilus]
MSASPAKKPSPVYFANFRARTVKENKLSRIAKLFEVAGFKKLAWKDSLTAVKVHFGELGNDTFISPVLVRAVVDKLVHYGAKPFLTDTATLYSGSRENAVDHMKTALAHGFGPETAGAPIVIADGLRGNCWKSINIGKKHFKTAKVALGIAEADALMVVSHFKGHEMAGFGGAIKNLAMGCAPPAGKRDQHSPRFKVSDKRCVGCAACFKVCPQKAITIAEKKASIDREKCIGCGECLTVCQEKAIYMDWATEMAPFTERMVEYAFAAIKGRKNKVGFLTFLMNITPDCDCIPWSDAPIVPDIGMMASTDPVALDKACLDMVNAQAALVGTQLACNHAPGEHKFKGLWTHTMGDLQLSYAEEIGLGTTQYELVEI